MFVSFNNCVVISVRRNHAAGYSRLRHSQAGSQQLKGKRGKLLSLLNKIFPLGNSYSSLSIVNSNILVTSILFLPFQLLALIFRNPLPTTNEYDIAELSQRISQLENLVTSSTEQKDDLSETTTRHKEDYKDVGQNDPSSLIGSMDISFYLMLTATIVIAVAVGITFLWAMQAIDEDVGLNDPSSLISSMDISFYLMLTAIIVIAVAAGITFLWVPQIFAYTAAGTLRQNDRVPTNVNRPPSTPSSKQRTPSQDDSSLTCRICYDAEINCFFEPCHHMYACINCAKTWKRTNNVCPVCCGHVTRITQVYF